MSTLRFEIFSYWQAGSGRGDGAIADAVALRSPENLPFLPGRTVKGLVREACELGVAAKVLGFDRVHAWFGSSIERVTPDDREAKMEEVRYRTEDGCLRFVSATLGDEWRAWAAAIRDRERAGEELTGPHPSQLFRLISSTAIESGVAQDSSLRTIEVAVPMTLTAPIGGLGAGDDALLRAVLPFIRGLGSQRNRGLGRVRVTLEGGI